MLGFIGAACSVFHCTPLGASVQLQGSESRAILRLLGAHSLPLLFQTQEEGDALTLTSDLLQLCHLLVPRCPGCTPRGLPQETPGRVAPGDWLSFCTVLLLVKQDSTWVLSWLLLDVLARSGCEPGLWLVNNSCCALFPVESALRPSKPPLPASRMGVGSPPKRTVGAFS